MISLHLIAADGTRTSLQCKPGPSLMQAAIASGVPGIEADCGGMMTCGTCHVYVHEPHSSRLAPPSDEEESMLGFTASPRLPNSRLSCQIDLDGTMDGLTVDLPPRQY